PPIPLTGVPVLDQETKSTGAINYNSSGYVAAADGYLKGFMSVTRQYPEFYLRSFKTALPAYFIPSWSYPGGVGNGAIRAFRYFDMITAGQRLNHSVGWFLVAGFPSLIVFGIVTGVRRYRLERQNPASYVPVLYMVFH